MRRFTLFLLLLLLELPSIFAATDSLVVDVEADRFRQRLQTAAFGPFSLVLRQLKPGEDYQLWLSPQAQQGGTVRFLAEDEAPTVTYRFRASQSYESIPVAQLTPNAENTRFVLSVSCSSCSRSTGARSNGLSVTSGIAASNLIRDVFIGGDCFDVDSVSLIGSTESVGQFELGSSSIGIESGVIISSGDASDAMGPNFTGNIGDEMDGGGHPDLAVLAGSNTLYDATGISFQFTPTVDSIAFRYTFASEEYCEFVDAGYNDVFGFFISGPGLNGGFTGNGENIAVLPGSNIGVTIDNINDGDNSAFFVPNSLSCGTFSINHNIQFDGFTTVLTAVAEVQACETYTINLLVGDVGDGLYDSAVFLEANSFSAGGTVTGSALSPVTNENTTYETCSDGFFSLDVGGDLSTTRTVNLTLSPNSTATPGVDFDSIPMVVQALPGQSTIEIPVNVFPDTLTEGQESIILEIENACSCTNGTVELWIQDSAPLEASTLPAEICPGDTISLQSVVLGGVPEYSYEWSNSASSPDITVQPTGTVTYTLTVTDQCGSTATTTAAIQLNDLPEVNFDLPPRLTCLADTVELSAVNSTHGTGFLLQWSTQDGQFATEPDGPTAYVNAAGVYTLAIADLETGCTNSGEIYVEADTIPPTADAGDDFVINCGATLASLDGAGSDRGAHISYQWSTVGGQFASEPTSISPDIGAAGVYTLLVTNAENGCSDQDEVIVTQLNPEASFELQQPLCHGDPGGIQFQQATGGTPPYQYSVDGGATYQESQSFAALLPGNYDLLVKDNNGCIFETSAFISQPDSTIAIIQPAEATIAFGENYTINVQTNLPDEDIAQVFWSNANTLDCEDCLRPVASPQRTTEYLMTIISQNGCTDQAVFRLFVDRSQAVYVPNAFSPNGDGSNDRFYIAARAGTVENIRTFQIYNRWGALVFKGDDLLPNNPAHGWDGTFHGEVVRNSVLAWFAEIEFTDGSVELLKGDLQLFR
ncbi:choice-of-anchor L domain-containing protein [Phaeodactylibacter xiamenensis]|uniref:choice-of-anchor L domain-containing protein n=1 Tax=Phaeodactylibacter xiamenensis TaxID=1524460 RepID=UPI003BA9524C